MPYAPFPGHRTLVRRAADFDQTRDTTSGHRVPVYAESNIDGTIEEGPGDMPAFGAGVVMTLDARLFTRDEVAKLDQVRDGTKYYEVHHIIEFKDKDGVLVYRECHMKRLELRVQEAAP